MKKLLLLLSLALSTSLASCGGEDPVTPDPNAGKRSTISAFYAHPGQTLPAYFEVDDSITISALEYGQYASGLAPVGNKKIVIQDQSGVEIATTPEVTINSSRSVWAIYAGLATNNEAIAISDTLGPALSAPLAGVRFINASKNASKTKVHLDVAQGSELTTNAVEFGKSNGTFKPINASTTALVMVDESNKVLVSYPLTGAAALEAGKKYTLIMYGNAATGATSNQVTARLIMEPNQ
jgi:hypothetical protein